MQMDVSFLSDYRAILLVASTWAALLVVILRQIFPRQTTTLPRRARLTNLLRARFFGLRRNKESGALEMAAAKAGLRGEEGLG